MKSAKVDYNTYYTAMAFTTFSKRLLCRSASGPVKSPKIRHRVEVKLKIRSSLTKRNVINLLQSAIKVHQGYTEKEILKKAKPKC